MCCHSNEPVLQLFLPQSVHFFAGRFLKNSTIFFIMMDPPIMFLKYLGNSFVEFIVLQQM